MATMPIYNMTDLWNSGGTTYEAIKMNVTDSASAAASRLMTLQVGSVDKSYITKAGLGYFAGGLLLAAATALTFGSSDVAVTHSTDLLAFSGAASGYTFDAKVTVGHTANLSIGGNADNFEVFGTTAATGGVAIGMFNATAGTGPHLDFYRSKDGTMATATVVASGDVLGSVNAYGAQQTGTFATQTMAAQIRFEVDGTVTSGASGDMPGRIVFATTADAGSSVTNRLILDSAGVLKPNANDGVALGTTALSFSDLFLADGGVINWNNGDVLITQSTNLLAFSGASSGYTFDAVIKPSSNDGAALGASGTAWSDAFLASGAVLNFAAGDLTITHSTGILDFASGTYRFATSNSAPGNGNNVTGTVITASTMYASVAGTVMLANRTTDGTLFVLSSQGVQQGSISIAGSTTSYNAITGSHFAQWLVKPDGEIRIGTILDSVDDPCIWMGAQYIDHAGNECKSEAIVPNDAKIGDVFIFEEKYTDAVTNKEMSFSTKATVVALEDTKHVKVIIGEERSSSCYGTLFRHDEVGEPDVAAVGTWVVLMAPETRGTVKRGDWIECAGNGMGRPQAEPYRLNSTVCKIISADSVQEWPDGAYTLRCSF